MHRLLLLLLPLSLASCQSTTTKGVLVQSAAHESTIPNLVGAWKFSHFGAPTVSNAGAPDLAALARPQFDNASITISADGTVSMIMGGRAKKFQMLVTDESHAFVKLRMKGQPDGNDFVYDKAQKTLMMPTKMEVNQSKGILPTYFRRDG